jgi:Glycosyltransferases involved in cell wall biogenesis
VSAAEKTNLKELAVIIPVYNEAGIIAAVLQKWNAKLSELQIDFEIHVYNDGSKDGTPVILKRVAASNPGIIVHDKPNSGHGPTILQGYRENSNARWLFQVDSDDEMDVADFDRLWSKRSGYDFIIGIRDGRHSPKARRIISLVSRLVIRLFYGRGVWDVNSPYRLLRSEHFRKLFFSIPGDTFAPNVIISGYACLKKLRILQLPVKYHDRTTGEVSIQKWKLFKAALKSFTQTIGFRFGL